METADHAIRQAVTLAFFQKKYSRLLARCARALAFARKHYAAFVDSKDTAAAVNFSNTEDFLFLPEAMSAKHHWRPENILLFVLLFLVCWIIFFVFYFGFGISPLVAISGFLALFYGSYTAFKVYVALRARGAQTLTVSDAEVQAVNESELPIYTILIPLYREEEVIGQIVKAMTAIDYPPEKLDIIVTLEEYDYHTAEAIRKAGLPGHFKTLILPNVNPKTKPKALNVALKKAKGEYLVIYDAEIIPDPDQLKKAYLLFKRHPELGTLQPRLDHYNAHHNLLTSLFNAEFSFYYDFFLPGLQTLGYPIPLSGHSTHFRTSLIRKVGGWDPYNLTEDCEIGVRLARFGWKTAVFNSVSREEATPTVKSWISQRSRWTKGFVQTTIVHLRNILKLKEDLGSWGKFFAFLMIVPGSVILNAVNIVSWALLVIWLFTQAEFIQTLFPGPILYLSMFNFFMGTFLFTYLNLVSLHQRGRYALVKHSLLSPIYWFLLATATVRGVLQLFTRPYHWEKTMHGTHLKNHEHYHA
jgi:cellulose synthase/poly-beta-1,6-N-acetylglucosamine synthase-like glycosyltransferase